ncbi:DUF6225 family protein, partial [Nonomuraea sp. NPDC005650]|uniref:DUF6225 family protein n=1 Tax=Nonomuraea sp. NPDC005650 TaxID=3157045 RepID=UPI0033A12202
MGGNNLLHERRRAARAQEGDPVPRTGVVPWETVTSPGGERAWTVGLLREALAGLPDDAPVIVHVASESDLQTVDDQII